jgi:hypothetical protein
VCWRRPGTVESLVGHAAERGGERAELLDRKATTPEETQVALCGRCDARLLVAGPPAGKGSSALFSVACVRCRARVVLPIAYRRVTSVSLAPIENQ